MIPSAEILARALEQDAEAQDRGEFSKIGMSYDEVELEIAPINEISPKLYGLAMRFWDSWCDAANHEWRYHEPFSERDWPNMARTIALHLREDTWPRDPKIVEHFLPKPRQSLASRIKRIFNVSA